MVDILNNEKGPFQVLFGDDASANPNVIFPIILVVFVVLIIVALRIVFKDKGRSDMTDEELEKDRALFDERMRKQAAFMGEEYDPALARAKELEEINDAKRRIGK